MSLRVRAYVCVCSLWTWLCIVVILTPPPPPRFVCTIPHFLLLSASFRGGGEKGLSSGKGKRTKETAHHFGRPFGSASVRAFFFSGAGVCVCVCVCVCARE